MSERSYLVQRFARIQLGNIHLIGYSVAGEETVCQIPEMGVCFDIGRAPHFCLNSNIVCISHAHMDHLAGIAYYLSQRNFQGMKPGIVCIHEDLVQPLESMLRAWRVLERQQTPYEIIPMVGGDDYAVRRDFLIRAVQSQHTQNSLGYALINVREKLKPEYMEHSGPELAQMKRDGVEIQYRLEVPLVAFTGDTSAGAIFDHPDIQNAQVLITECTFFERDHATRAKAGKHLHFKQFLDIIPKLKNEQIVLTHVTRRTGIRRAKRALVKALGQEALLRFQFLMDFEGSSEAGDIESISSESASS